MAIARPLLAALSIIFLAGAIVLQFFIILSGTGVNSTPINKTWFLQASTDGIPGNLPNPARWTYFQICGAQGGHNANCLGKRAALPFDPPKNFHTRAGIPPAFIGTDYYYLLSRFAWVFFLIALVFAVLAFFMSVFALCARLGAYLTGFLAFLALFFQTLACALMTAWTVKARSHFHNFGMSAKLGTYAYAFSWAAMASLFIATLLFCLGGSVGGKSERNYNKKSSYFGRKRSTRSRGSFVDGENNRTSRIKDDYD